MFLFFIFLQYYLFCSPKPWMLLIGLPFQYAQKSFFFGGGGEVYELLKRETSKDVRCNFYRSMLSVFSFTPRPWD